MDTPQQLAEHLKQVFFGKNWTCVNVADTLKNIDWQMATKKVGDCNTIAQLTFHIAYYLAPVSRGIDGLDLDAHDKYSFNVPDLNNQEDWNALTQKIFFDVDILCNKISLINASKLNDFFVDEKYGSFHRNLLGLIEHTHYHLGQIVLLKKILTPISTPEIYN